MGLNITIISYKEYIDGPHKPGLCISSNNSLNKDGSVILNKYFSLELETPKKIKFIDYMDMYDILYINNTQQFEIGEILWQ